jgi:hypothetical protein
MSTSSSPPFVIRSLRGRASSRLAPRRDELIRQQADASSSIEFLHGGGRRRRRQRRDERRWRYSSYIGRRQNSTRAFASGVLSPRPTRQRSTIVCVRRHSNVVRSRAKHKQSPYYTIDESAAARQQTGDFLGRAARTHNKYTADRGNL